MNTLEKLAQVNKAAKHVARQRLLKKAFDENWVDMVKYLAETGQLAPESIDQLKKLHDQGMLSKILRGSANGALGWGTGSALATGLWAALSGAANGAYPLGAGILDGVLRGGGIGLGIGTITGGLDAGLRYKKEKEQLKSILDAANANAPQPSIETTPESELATAASV